MLWYSPFEIQQFRQTTVEQLATLRQVQDDPWHMSLQRVHQATVMHHRSADLMPILRAVPFDVERLGLERAAVGGDATSCRLHEASRTLSRPARLWARHLAVVALEGANET